MVTYVVNRNINFTNVCIKHCTFCAFSRDHREEEGYLLPLEEVIRRAREAQDLGATEVCIQAGLPPKLDGRFYIDLCRAIHEALPDLHIHAFSPEEVLYGVTRSGMPIAEYLTELREAGLGTLPGTSAEILDDEVRDVISRGRISTRQWIEVVTTAHRLGIRTTSTMMYGHVETPAHWVRHMALLRDIQKDTGGFTEFVPLSLIHQEAPMYRRHLVPDVRAGATGAEVVRVHALARLMLGATMRNIQCSWVKEGPKLAQMLLAAGAERPGRNADQREHLDLGRRRPRSARAAARAAPAGARPRSNPRPAQHDVRYPQALCRLAATTTRARSTSSRTRRSGSARTTGSPRRVSSASPRCGLRVQRAAPQNGRTRQAVWIHRSHPFGVASPPHPERRRFDGEGHDEVGNREQRWPASWT